MDAERARHDADLLVRRLQTRLPALVEKASSDLVPFQLGVLVVGRAEADVEPPEEGEGLGHSPLDVYPPLSQVDGDLLFRGNAIDGIESSP
jgi:hypothetical protein